MQASVAYVTGAHALKVGFQNDFGTSTSAQYNNEYGLFYTFNNGVPVSIEQHALPFSATTHLSLDLGIYVQDKWTFKRATINGAAFRHFKNYFPEQHLGPASFVPNRDVTIPGTPTPTEGRDAGHRHRLRPVWRRQDRAEGELGQVPDRRGPDGQPGGQPVV